MAWTEAEEVEYLRLLEAEAHSDRFFSTLFPKQRKAFRHPSKRKVFRCSRRAGKSELAATALLKTAEDYPETISVYVGLTRKSSKRIMWGRLKKLAKTHGVKIDPSETELIIKLSNGSEIWLVGANDEAAAETLRGNAFKLVVLDECASFRGHIDSLIEEIIEPALIDQDGTLMMLGTPSWDFSSYFYKADHDCENWQSFHWTILDNPHIPRAAQWIADLKKRRKWSDDNPIYLREYGGQWARSGDEMVYLFNPLRDLIDKAPNCEFYYLGVDLGFDDETAFAVIGHNRHERVSYVVHTEKHKGWKPTEIAKRIVELDKRYDFFKMVCDEGGLGKMVAEEFRTRFAIPIRAAKKTEKRSYIEFMNAEFNDEKIKVVEGQPVLREWDQLIWKAKKNSEGERGSDRKVEDPNAPNHCADAVLYAWRESLAYLEEALSTPPKPGTQEWFDEQERLIEKARERKYRKRETTLV